MGRERRFGREGVWLPWATSSEGVWSSGGVGGSGRGCLGREGKLRTGDESSRTKTYYPYSAFSGKSNPAGGALPVTQALGGGRVGWGAPRRPRGARAEAGHEGPPGPVITSYSASPRASRPPRAKKTAPGRRAPNSSNHLLGGTGLFIGPFAPSQRGDDKKSPLWPSRAPVGALVRFPMDHFGPLKSLVPGRGGPEGPPLLIDYPPGVLVRPGLSLFQCHSNLPPFLSSPLG